MNWKWLIVGVGCAGLAASYHHFFNDWFVPYVLGALTVDLMNRR